MSDAAAESSDQPHQQHELRLGLLAAPGLARDLADVLAGRLTSLLEERVPDVKWQVEVRTEPLAGAASMDVDLIKVSRERLLNEDWHFAVCLTTLPLRIGRRPVTASASVPLGVGVVSVPAFGAVDVEDRVSQAVLRLVEGLASGDGAYTRRAGARRRSRARLGVRLHKLREVSSPVGTPHPGDRGTVRFVTSTGPGNLRLLLGMVRANRPWRLIIGLSKALVAALGAGAFGLTSAAIWRVGDAMGWLRLLTLGLVSISAITVTLIVAHGLWERPRTPATRSRILLINIATTSTIVLGSLTLFAALLVITTLCDTTLLLRPVLEREVNHAVSLGIYLQIAWLATCMATLGGALGAVVESDLSVHEATFGYRAEGNSDDR
ncbi:MAG TPA: hypothetical protein VGD71_35860 [Kribbella sp.]